MPFSRRAGNSSSDFEFLSKIRSLSELCVIFED